MCLILIAWRVHPRYPLIVAANRDEFYARPTLPAQRWPGDSGMIAGKDLEAGGSWMGVDASGRFAAVTNFRELEQGPTDARSRGGLVTDYLLGDAPAESYLAELAERADQYRGYNLLLTDGGELYCASNRGAPIRNLPPGVHGVCNGPLDSDWPKVKRGRQLLAKAIDRIEPSPKQLFELLRDQTQPADEALPDTGVGLESDTPRHVTHLLRTQFAELGGAHFFQAAGDLREETRALLVVEHQSSLRVMRMWSMPHSSNTSPCLTNPKSS